MLTTTRLQAAIAFEVVHRLMFGESLSGPFADIVAHNWRTGS
jgi:hypothetical protein